MFVLIYKPTLFHRLPDKKYVEVTRADTEGQIALVMDEVERAGIREHVRLIEWPENVDELISACDLMVAPFLSARFSSVYLLEAMAKGKPVIATDLGEQRDVIKDGVNGFLVRPGDLQELSSRISQLVSDPEELARLARGARSEADKYSADAYARRLENLYTELAGNGRGEPTPGKRT